MVTCDVKLLKIGQKHLADNLEVVSADVHLLELDKVLADDQLQELLRPGRRALRRHQRVLVSGRRHRHVPLRTSGRSPILQFVGSRRLSVGHVPADEQRVEGRVAHPDAFDRADVADAQVAPNARRHRDPRHRREDDRDGGDRLGGFVFDAKLCHVGRAAADDRRTVTWNFETILYQSAFISWRQECDNMS